MGKNGFDRSMIKIICVGKIKEQFFEDAIKEYLKRLSKYTKIEIIEVPDISDDNIDCILAKESEKIIKNINDKDFVISLEVEGDLISSEVFAEKISSIQMINPNICFVIGGSHGLSKNIKKRSDYALSFSKMTFPHQLFRIVLLEQIYRAFKINNNESYHK